MHASRGHAERRAVDVDGRPGTFLVEGDEVICIEVKLKGPDDEIPWGKVAAAVRREGLTSGVNLHVAWVEGDAGLDGTWRGVATFHPNSWRPEPTFGPLGLIERRTSVRC